MKSVLNRMSFVCKFLFMAAFAVALFKDDLFLFVLSFIPMVGYLALAGEEGES
jgi:hypothetical protein